MAATQPSLFLPRDLPEGFQYQDEVLSPDQEQILIEEFALLPFREFEFRGFLARGEPFPSAGDMTSMSESFKKLRKSPRFYWASARVWRSLPACREPNSNTSS
jgi:hypothetical protein